MNSADSINDILIPVVAGTLLLATLIVFIGYFIFLHYKTRQKFDWERQQFKQAVLQTEIEIREQTLTQISRELHDNLGQIASVIKINLNLVSKDLKTDDKQKVEDSIDLLKRMIADIKSLSLSLNSENLRNMGLVEALSNDVNRINKTGHILLSIRHTGPPPELSAEAEVFIYRMGQEIINNTLKHAAASTLSIDIENEGRYLKLQFADNGKGFDPKAPAGKEPRGNGLNNLYKRCKIIHADLVLESGEGMGTKITITLPLHPN